MSADTPSDGSLEVWHEMLLATVERDNFEQVNLLIDDLKTKQCPLSDILNYINNGMGVTLLQVAVFQNNQPIVELLIEQGARVDHQDRLGRTAAHLAALTGSSQLLQVLIQKGADINAKYEILSSHRINGTVIGKKIPMPDNWGRTPLHMACKYLHPNCVKLLLDSGADPSIPDKSGLTPPLVIGEHQRVDKHPGLLQKFETILKLLADHDIDMTDVEDETGRSLLFRAVEFNSITAFYLLVQNGVNVEACDHQEQSVLHWAAKKDRCQMVKEILNCVKEQTEKGKRKKFINNVDKYGDTCLHVAAREGSRQTLKLLIERGGDLSVVNQVHMTVTDVIFSNLPRPTSLFTELFNDSIKTNNSDVNQKTFAVNVDFGVLIPNHLNQMSVLVSIIETANEYQLSKLLSHPYIETFLRLKWKRVTIFYYFLVFIHLCFVLSLSSHVLIVNNREKNDYQLRALRFSSHVLLVSGIIILLHVLCAIVLSPKYFFKEYETWIILVSGVLSFIIGIYGEYASNSELCKTKVLYECQKEFIHHVSAVAVLVGWIQFMLVLGRFPAIGYFSLMFFTVLTNVIKVLAIFSCLIVGFALSFYIQFSGQQFGNILLTLIKTIVMLMGEYDYQTIFRLEDEDLGVRNQFPSRVAYKQRVAGSGSNQLTVTAYFCFLVFMVIGSIVFMNLMVGLAVSDIQAIVQEGRIRRIIKQSEFISHFETLMSNRIRFFYIPRFVRQFLHHRKHISNKIKIKPGRSKQRGFEELPVPLKYELTRLALANVPQDTKGGVTPVSDDVDTMEDGMEMQDLGTERIAEGGEKELKKTLSKLCKDVKMISSFLKIEKSGSATPKLTGFDARKSRKNKKYSSGW